MRQMIVLGALFISSTRQELDLKTQINSISDNLDPQLENIEATVKEKCATNGADEKMFATLMSQPIELNSCLENFLNFTQIQEELERSKKNGSMDQVFVKYCSKYPQIYQCVKNASESLRPCLTSPEQDLLDKGLKYFGTLKEYMCFKDGIRLSMFISQGGIECMESKSEKVKQCVTDAIVDRLPVGVSVHTLPELSKINVTTLCNGLFEMRFCFYEELTQCKQNIPANVIDAFFKFLKNQLSCETPLAYRESQIDDIWIRVIVVVVFILVVALVSYKILVA